MKKVLSVLLAAIMIFACMPLVFADDPAPITDINFYTSGNFESSNQLESGYTYTINSGVTMTVKKDVSLYIPSNCELIVAEGGTLDLQDSLIIVDGGKLTVNGTVLHADRIQGSGTALAKVDFPAISASNGAGYPADSMNVAYAYGTRIDDDVNAVFSPISVDGASVYVPLNKYLFVKTDLVYDGDLVNLKYDDNKVGVSLTKSGAMTVRPDGIKAVKVVDSGEISYTPWTQDGEPFLKEYTVVLNAKEVTGYTIYDSNGNTENVKVAYGKPFRFRIEFDENYSYAATTAEIYIYNGKGVVTYDQRTPAAGVEPSKPDANGYFTIPSIQSDYTIYVSWLPMDDDTVGKVGGILQTIRSVFELIINFFRQIMNVFNIGG